MKKPDTYLSIAPIGASWFIARLRVDDDQAVSCEGWRSSPEAALTRAREIVEATGEAIDLTQLPDQRQPEQGEAA